MYPCDRLDLLLGRWPLQWFCTLLLILFSHSSSNSCRAITLTKMSGHVPKSSIITFLRKARCHPCPSCPHSAQVRIQDREPLLCNCPPEVRPHRWVTCSLFPDRI